MQKPLEMLLDAEAPEPHRIEAARALARARDLGALDGLFGAIEATDTLVSRAVVEALRAMGAHEVLGARLGDADPAVRADAARKLSKLKDERAIDPLSGAVHDPELGVRRAAVRALSYLRGERVAEALVSALRDQDPETRAHAAAGLARSGDPRAAGALVAARERESHDVVKDFIDAALRKVPAAKAGAK
ncbi:MAG TPA: HEAT repeat domain-containing protein [Planctomycetota bacterium]|nr:HEAT repeat domain-containing protein [Planctomycetota bacterium]